MLINANLSSEKPKIPSTKPNVILVITDDQGYGDLGCTGNPWIQTPNIDNFYNDSVRFVDFHVHPLCAPTRGALMSGHRPLRNGVWATTWGRSMLRKDEVTIANVFDGSGYRTGMFGKWHLGDNYPYRPQDRGFQTVVAHKGGGVGQTPDFWGNNYFDDTYFHNSQPVSHEGYCTDVWFDEAMKFIEDSKGEPFFAYISTNAPHSPYLVDEKYSNLYIDNPDIPEPHFYGMITNIDENFGKLRKKLAELNIEDDTILIFMTDNGSSAGAKQNKEGFITKGYNAGMRGMKASFYDGGHRVPLFIRWPNGNLEGGNDISEMGLDVDFFPTLVNMCGLEEPTGVDFDGTSLLPLLKGEVTETINERVSFVQYHQNTNPPEKWINAVITPRWRLINGNELYDIKADPWQFNDISNKYPDVVSQLRDEHEKWWAKHCPNIDEYCPISLGNDAENPTRLDAFDVMGDVAWSQCNIAAALKSVGKWAVDIEQEGAYRFSLRRWPEELNIPIDDIISEEDVKNLAPYIKINECHLINPVKAVMKLFDNEIAVDVKKGDKEAVFTLTIEKTGVTQIEAWFADEQGEYQGAYYVYVERL